MKVGRIVLRENMRRFTDWISDMTAYFQDGGHDVILRRKVLPSGVYSCSVRPAPAIAYAAASAGCHLATLSMIPDL